MARSDGKVNHHTSHSLAFPCCTSLKELGMSQNAVFTLGVTYNITSTCNNKLLCFDFIVIFISY